MPNPKAGTVTPNIPQVWSKYFCFHFLLGNYDQSPCLVAICKRVLLIIMTFLLVLDR